jgi:hypothetical protein
MINRKLVNLIALCVLLFIPGVLTLNTAIANHQYVVAMLPTNDTITLGEPFFIERYPNSTVQPQPQGTTFNTTGFGTGLLNGTTEVDTEANATMTFRDSQTMFLEGRAKYTDSNNDDTAYYKFLELGKINPIDLSYFGGGIAIFDGNSTGTLKSLSDVVAVYKSVIDANGNATVYYYHWN